MMATTSTTQPILIIDTDSEFLQKVLTSPFPRHAPPFVASSRTEAQLKLSDRKTRYAGIFINPRVAEPAGLSLIRYAHAYCAGTPIYLLTDPDDKNPPSKQELNALAVHDIVRKPIAYDTLVNMVAPIAANFDSAVAIAAQQANADPLNAEINRDDEYFLAVYADRFLSGKKSFFDVYVRLGAAKFVKILSAGDSFSTERVQIYMSKGVTHFYLRREAQQSYLDYCAYLTSNLLQKQSVPTGIKTNQVLNHGEQVLQYLTQHGLQREMVWHASQFAQNAIELVNKLNVPAHTFCTEFMKDLVRSSHGAATTMIAALLVKSMGIESERLKNIIALAALLHDIGKDSNVPYIDHARNGAKLLSTMRGLDPIIIQAVAQHHMRRDGSGFPEGDASRVGEIVGISNAFLHVIENTIHTPLVSPLVEMENRVFNGFSYPIIEAFRTAFKPS